jgi:hypothetical protein
VVVEYAGAIESVKAETGVGLVLGEVVVSATEVSEVGVGVA